MFAHLDLDAWFIGRTSCGFVENTSYRIRIKYKDNCIWVFDRDGWGRCAYSDFDTMAANWHIGASNAAYFQSRGKKFPLSNRIYDD